MSNLYLGHFVQFFDDNGDPLASGTVTFYEPGTTTKKDVYTDSGLSTPASNPVTLDSAGRVTVFLNGDYKARLEDSGGALVDETDNINPPVTTETTGGNLIANGSFETEGVDATTADGWTLTAQSDGTIERVTADNYDGTAALKMTSTGNGGGQADTDSFFAVTPGRNYGVSFAIKCSVADIRNIVQVRYFDKDKSFLSNSSVYDEDTSNPTSWTLKSFIETPPANARFAKLRILGADQSDATSGNARFDTVSVRDRGALTATDEELNNGIQPGFLQMYAGSSEPSGWLFCSGQAISRTTFSDLFNVIGTTYGVGDGATTFNVPDLRDRFPLGENTMGASDAGRVGTDTTALGDTGGADTHTLTTSEMPSHDHGGGGNTGNTQPRLEVNGIPVANGGSSGSSGQIALDDDGTTGGEPEYKADNHSHTYSISSEGGDGAHNNMPPFQTVNFIIKT